MPSSIRNSASMYGISCADGCWKASISRNKVRFFRSFSFDAHGGREAALVKAQAWRDEMVRLHPPILRREKAVHLQRNNTTGISGVTSRTDHAGRVVGPGGQRVDSGPDARRSIKGCKARRIKPSGETR